jgi:eukaryotic-like serine/threonine-protein kinase
MKRCPQCNRVENDEALKFCRADGTALTNDSSSIDSDAGTVRLGSSLSSEIETSVLPNTTDAVVSHGTAPTTALPAQQPPTTIRELSKPKLRKPAIVLSLLAAVVLGATLIGGYFYYSRKSNTAIESIAVLPFENRSGSEDTDYLSDGLAESLIYRLSQLPNLKVSPTSSVMRYKGKGGELKTIANELGVSSVLTGRLVQRGDNLTISIELVDVRNNKLLWGEQYERKMSELLATQREIAAEIANKLQLKLSGEGEQKLAKKYTDSNEAYQLYLKGRFYWNKRDEENLRKAIEQFRAAVEKDPNFALAYVGLADSYALLPFYSGASSAEVVPPAKAYAERALGIDNSLGEAHTSLAYVYRLLWNWAESEKNSSGRLN